jgi:hypothetical protein
VYTEDMDMDFWDFHEVGNPECPACYVPPVPCTCGGAIHTQLDEGLEAVEGKCEDCEQVADPEEILVD